MSTMTISTKTSVENEPEKESFQDASEGPLKTLQPEPSRGQEPVKEGDVVPTSEETKEDETSKEPDVDPGMDLSTKELYRKERYEDAGRKESINMGECVSE